MNNDDRPDYTTLYNAGREMTKTGMTLPDNTPNLTGVEREIIRTGQQDQDNNQKR